MVLVSNRSSLYYKHLIIAVYLSAFEMLIRGISIQFSAICETIAVAMIQGWVYILPLLMLIAYPIKGGKYIKINRILVLIQIIYVAVVVAPVCLDDRPLELLFKGIKNFYLPLVIYFVVIDHLLINYDRFVEKFLSHIIRIGIIFGMFITVEAALLFIAPGSSLLSSLRLISFSFKNRAFSLLDEIRPIGMYYSMQYSGLLFAMLAAICFHFKKKICGFKPKRLFYFFLFCLLVSTAKTYTFAFILYLIWIGVLSFNMRKFLIVFCAFLAIAAFVLSNKNFADYYSGMLFGESNTRYRMIDKWGEFGWHLEHGIIPNGFMPELENPDESPIYIPFEYLDGEVYAYKMVYQLGVVGFFMWAYTVWRPLFTLRIRKVLLNPYGGVLFVSACGLIHYLTIFPIFLFSIVIFSQVMILRSRYLQPSAEPAKIKCFNDVGGK